VCDRKVAVFMSSAWHSFDVTISEARLVPSMMIYTYFNTKWTSV
jgi:hypothetical protein